MATSTYLVSTALMGVLVLGVAFLVARGRAWRQYRPAVLVRDRDVSLANDPGVWMLGFILLIGISMAVTLLAAGGGSVVVFLGVAGALVLGFLAVGVYVTARSNGHPHAYAVGETILTLGLLLLVGIAGWLVTTAGA